MASRKHEKRLTLKSASTGNLSAAKLAINIAQTHRRKTEEAHIRKIVGSPQGLYCRNLPHIYGSDTCERFWPRVWREMERRNGLIDHEESSSSDDSDSENESQRTAPRGPSLKSHPPYARAGVGFILDLKKQIEPTRAEKAADAASFLSIEDTMQWEIREGCRVCILGRKPTDVGKPRVWPPTEERRCGTCADALKVWKAYGDILEMGRKHYLPICGDSDADDHSIRPSSSASRLPSRSSRLPSIASPSRQPSLLHPDLQISRQPSFPFDPPAGSVAAHFSTMDWPSLHLWAEQLCFDEGSAAYKSSCQSLRKGLATWHKTHPDGEEQGVPLLTMLRWIWPQLSYRSAYNMLAAICLHEIEKVQIPTPPLLDDADRQQIERLFEAMDTNHNGYLSSEELAGGDSSDIMTQLRNCIDPVSVRTALGGGAEVQCDLPQFLELMCPDGTRGHPDTKTVVLADGRPAIWCEREPTEFKGWILKDTSKEDKEQWRLVDAIEAQIRAWRKVAEGRRATKRGTMLGVQGAMRMQLKRGTVMGT